MQCPKCNASIDADSRFCGRCGQPALAGVGATAAIPAAANPAVAFPGAATAAAAPADAASGSARLPRLLERIKNIVLQPKLEWLAIAPEPTSTAQLYIGYVMPLAAFAAVMSFLHMSVIGVSVPFAGVIRTPIAGGL